MQFKVPQFIDVEDKLFGPFTFRQFIYIVGGAGMAFVVYKLFPLWIGIFLIIPIGVLSFLLVFYKINEKPFIYYLEAAFNYFISGKLYIWKQRLVKPEIKEKEESSTPQLVSVVPMVTSNKLKDLSWSLDVQDSNRGEKE
ncbi:MAG: PrgI family protein [Candidatus Nomurabacteria bacterium]|nr:PrgI family protein [Candidatus Nomurabacteria bacterium]